MVENRLSSKNKEWDAEHEANLIKSSIRICNFMFTYIYLYVILCLRLHCKIERLKNDDIIMKDLTNEIDNMDLDTKYVDINVEFNVIMESISEFIYSDTNELDDPEENIDQKEQERRKVNLESVLVRDEDWNKLNAFSKTKRIKECVNAARNRIYNRMFENLSKGMFTYIIFLVYVYNFFVYVNIFRDRKIGHDKYFTK